MGYQGHFLLVGNASYLNRGCEAILRGTVKILRNAFGECRFTNANFDVTDPPYMPVESDPDVVHRPLPTIRRLSARWTAVKAAERLWPSMAHQMRFGDLHDGLEQSEIVLSVGGDNYTLDYGIPRKFVDLDKYVLAHGRPLVIWGASVGPFDQRSEFADVMHEHLRREVTAIFVREKRSYDYLIEHGIDNVHLMSDPAFVMDTEPVSRSDLGFELPDGAIGLNLSPLMARHVTNGDEEAWERVGVDIARELLKKYDRSVLLVPHVTSSHSDDHLLLSRIGSQLADPRVMIVPKTLSAGQTKYVISQLACLVAARTHATIASLSTCVPTVSLAYSRKAWGINEMMFGHTSYVIAPTEVTPDSVATVTDRVLEDSPYIRSHLSEKVAMISKEAMAAGTELKRIVACA